MVLLLLACTGAPPKDGSSEDSGEDSPADSPTNAAPTVTAVLTPDVLTTDTQAAVTIVAEDPEGAALTTAVRWFVDGVEAGQGDTLDGSAFTRDQEVRVEVEVSDGELTATATDSAVVANAAPLGGAVEIEQETELSGAVGLRCSVTSVATDPDGDPVTFRLAWQVDGAAFAGAVTDDEPGDYVLAGDTGRGRTWTCVATPTDGGADGAPVTAAITLSGPSQGQYAWDTVLDDLYLPADLAPLPDGTFLVATLAGELHHLDLATGTRLGATKVLPMEEELIAIAVDPRFGDGAHDWVFGWTSDNGNLYRWRLQTDPFAVTEEVLVLDVDVVADTDGHCGGGLQFWQHETGEPTLYLGVGPAVRADPQATDNLGKKMLAFAVEDDGAVRPVLSAYGDDPRIAALGLRNPWRIEDCGAALCIAEPGVSTWEEINLYTHAGQNFGFDEVEGPGDGTFDEPVAYWHDDDDAWLGEDLDGGGATSFVNTPYVGPRISGRGYGGRLEGWVFFGDFFDAAMRALYVDDKGQSTGDSIPVGHGQYVMAMAEAADGTLYAVELGGSVLRLVHRADKARPGPLGQALSETPFVDAVVFEPRYTLWSNGADKERLVYLPEGATIDTSDPGRWVWPDGTHLYKTFTVEGQPVETRVLWKDGETWVPGVYQWDGADAYLTDGFRTEVMLDNGDLYTIPPNTLCADCHHNERGQEWPLGLSDFLLGEEGLVPLATMLSTPITDVPEAPGDAADRRVRGYLQANCAFCHHDDGIVSKVSPAVFDLSYDADIDTSVVAQYYHANPNLDDGDPIFDTVRPGESVLVRVMENVEMPPVGVWTPDNAMIAEIEAWIARL